MQIKSKGFIFLAVLLFLQFFSMLGLYTLMKSSITLKTIRHLWQRDDYVLASEQLLRQLEAQFPSLSACLIPVTPSAQLARRPITWWQQHGCSDTVNRISYYAVVESLGKDPCGVIEKQDNQLITADFYRITLLALPRALCGSRVILQSLIVRPVVEISPCQTGLHLITLGRQQWREI